MSPDVVLGRPLTLPCGAVLSNRMAKAAMSEGLAEAGLPTGKLEALYARFARGGAGLLVTGNIIVSPEGIAEPGNVVLRANTPLAPFAAWARAATSTGVHAFAQLNHAGRQTARGLSADPVAPSAIRSGAGALFATPRALAQDEIHVLIDRFARASRIARDVGFTGVQLHAAHGYLLSQFLSPRANRRTDAYGGSLDNRMRFLLEVYRAVRAACGARFPVSVKLNSADFLRGGFTPEESLVVARTLSDEGVDLLEVSGGTYESPRMFLSAQSTKEREAHFLEYAVRVRAVISSPLMLTGGLRTPSVMAGLVAGGEIDVVGMARALAREPDFPKEVLAGRQRAARMSPPRGCSPFVTAALEASSYQHQLHRMALGLEPEVEPRRWRALGTAALGFLRSQTAPRRACGDSRCL